jgi:ketosteroid isomerase-like protein
MSETKGSVETKIAIMRAAYEAWPDVDGYLREFRDDAVWHSPVAGDVRGKEAIRAYLSRVLQSVEEWTVDIHDVLVSEKHTVLLCWNDVRFTNGQLLQALPSAEVLHQDDEGLATDVWPMFDTERYRKALAGTG